MSTNNSKIEIRNSVIRATRKGFTLIELLVVIAMLVILMGAATTSVVSAQRRAKISRAQTEAQELTKAILAYANYTDDGTLSELSGLDDSEASEDNLKYVLGKVTKRGSTVPVLYNASVAKNGKFLDPWGNPYRVTVKKGERIKPPGVPSMNVGIFYPNWHRVK